MSKKGFTYTLQIDAEINDLIAKTAQVRKSMQSIMDAGKAPGAEKIFTSIEKAIERLQTKASQPIESVAAFQNLQKDAAAVGVSLGKLGTIIENLGNMGVADKLDLLPPNLKKQIEDASSALAEFSKATAQAEQKSQDLVDAESQLAAAKKELTKAEGRVQDKKALAAAQQQLVKDAHAEADAIKEKIEALKKYQATAAAYEKAGGNKSAKGDSKANAGKGLEGLNLPGDRKAAIAAVPGLNPSDAQAVADAIVRLNNEYRQASKTVTDAEATQRRYNSQLNDANTAAGVASGKVATLDSTVARLNSEFEKDKAKNVQAAYSQLRTEAGKLGVDLTNIPLDYTEQNFNELNTAMNQLVANGISQVDTGLNVIQSEMGETATSAQNLGDRMNAASGEVVRLDRTVSDTTAFTQRIKQFVGLQGGIHLARTAMRNAINTIKELDKAMTEMAVVTEFEVGDYWDQLPEYTARANALGVSIKSAYESATLYYQQGLKTNEVIAISNETLKMARIAGLSAEDATNKMTAALRGFNMELNETSAQRVADVYSKLAAITASDVDEISSAMTKTASIAASAGMEFETTAAFLSQIIETTRESAETAGTALKTVIARFQELKKDPSEIGEVDGEVVDANKIETALRSVGVSLRDTRGQFRELDDVFLELSGKWDDLDTNTQRYIATIAAGSRQQSRFIAMMSDYSRTQELVTAANSSAGASNEQFEKTMDSLESKLNELKNAWDSFTMGIMNSDLLKAAIDLLTGILTTINNITDAFGAFSGAAKIGLLVAALYLGDKALKVFMSSLQGGSTIFQAFGATGRVALDSINKRFISLKKLFSAKLNIKVGSKELYNATLASKEYQRATEELKKVEIERAAAAKAGELGYEQSAMYSQQAADATARQSAAEKELMATMGLSITQMEAVQALQALDVATGDALILTKAGISAATLTEISAINGKTVAENASTLAQNLSNASGIRAISAKIGLTVANWAQTASENAKTGSLWASVTATIAQTMANWGLQASMWPILVIGLLIVAALVLLVGIVLGLIAAFKAWKANSPEARMEALREKTEAAKEAAEEATKAYEDLLGLHDSYASLINDVENLTAGTTEWKEAVVALNEKIAELLELYPQLAKYVSFAENGVMYIEKEGWDELLNQQASKARLAKVNQYYQENRQNREASRQIVHSQNKNAEKLTKKGRKLYTGKNKSEVDWAVNSLWFRDWGSATYNKDYSQLQELFAGDKKMLEILDEMNEAAKVRANLENQANASMKMSLWSLGSEAAQKDQNYGRIINSLVSYYAYDSDLVLDKGEARDYRWQEKYTDFWNEGSDSPTALLQAELAKYNLITSGSEKLDMAALLAAKGGSVYTKEEVEDMGKKADDNLSKELGEIYGLEQRGETIDEIYNLSKTDSVIGELYGGSLDIDLDKMSKYISDNYLGKGAISMAISQRIEDIEQAKADVDLELQKIYDNKQLTALDFTDSYDSAQEFIHTYNEMLSGVGAGLATNFANLFAGFDIEQQQSFFAEYENINWSSSIDGAAALKEMLLSDSVAMQEFAIATFALENKMYSATSQMNEFYKTLSSDALEELAADGQITAAEMLELAKTNEKLATMMDNTGVSAADLGNYYKLLTEGTISAYEATGNFVKALSELNAASSAIENAFGFVDTFEPLRSQTEISEYFADMRESAMELYDIGAYGDQQLKDYINAFLGDSNWQAIIDKNNGDMKAAIDEAMAQINSYGENLYGTWKTLVEQGLEGVSMGEDSSIQFDMSQIGSVEELKRQIMNMGWSEAMADALVADAQTFSADLQNNLDRLGIQNALQTWLSEAFSINGKTIIPKGQVEAMAKELKVPFEQLKKDLEDQGISVGEWVTEDGKIGKDFKDLREDMIKIAQEAGEFDLGTNYQLLLELGLDDDEAKAQLKSMSGSLTDVPFIMNGQTVKDASGVIYDSTGVAIEGGTTGGLIDGLEDPKVKAAQDLSAIEQGEMMAKANATGSIVASRIALQATAGEIDKIINGAIDILSHIGINIPKSHLADSVAGSTEQLVNSAISQIETRNKVTKETLNETINANITSADTSSTIENLTDKYVEKSEEKIVSSYITKNAQTKVEEEIEEWENPYDELYNLNQELNALLREREKLERAYARAARDSATTVKDLVFLTSQQVQSIYDEISTQENIAEASKDNITSLRNANSKFNNLYTYDDATGVINIKYEDVESLSQEDRDAFEKFITNLEKHSSTYFDATKAMSSALQEAEDLQEKYRQSTSDLYDAVKDGIMTQRQEEIDKLSEINESINEAQSKMLDKMQEQIDDARQARDNAKKEEAIQDKMTRLAYLRSDTSGANDLEIAKLEEEIAQEQQDYQDTLVDQAISDLQDANEKAAEQREEQIQLMQDQLDEYEKSGAIWADVQSIISSSFESAEKGMKFAMTDAGQLALLGQDYNSQNPFKQEDIITELEEMGTNAGIYTGNYNITVAGITGTLQEILKELRGAAHGDYQEAVSSAQSEIDWYSSHNIGTNVNSKEEILEQVKNPKTRMGEIYSKYAQSTLNPLSPEEFVSMLIPSSVMDYKKGEVDGYGRMTFTDSEIKSHLQSKILENFAKNLDSKKAAWQDQEILKNDLQAYYYDDISFLESIKGLYNIPGEYPSFNEVISSIKSEIGRRLGMKDITAFKTGGLADFTGPAWLDGTKSRPELVLNQTDTANFILLKDILAEILNGTSSINKEKQGKGGDNYYEVEINVESIGDDYDVEQMAEKIKSMIYNDASYRNVNAVNIFR